VGERGSRFCGVMGAVRQRQFAKSLLRVSADLRGASSFAAFLEFRRKMLSTM